MTDEAKKRVEELVAQIKGSPYEVDRIEDRYDGGAVIVLGNRGRVARINVSPEGKRE